MEDPSRDPEDPRPGGGDISWGAINNCPPLPVIFPELVSFVEGWSRREPLAINLGTNS